MAAEITFLNQVRVFLSDALHADLDDWTPSQSIVPISFKKNLFPEISVAKFVYYVGTFPVHFSGVASGTYSPISAMRAFIRLQIWRIYDANGDLLEEDDQVQIEDWIGIVNRTDLENLYGGTYVAGDLEFTAFGVEAELQHAEISTTHISQSVIGTSADDYFSISRAVGFNEDFYNHAPGNMHSYSGFSGVPLFSKVPNREIKNGADEELAAQWSVKDAIEYTLRRDLNAYTSGSTIPANSIQWGFATQTADLLSALPFPKLARERKTVHQILSELVPKKSGIACRIEFDTEGADSTKLRFVLSYFSTAKNAFTIDGYTFPKSPSITNLDLRFSRLIDDSFMISESAYDSWDQVIVEGAFITATMTIPLYDNSVYGFTTAWSETQEEDFVTPDVSDADSEEEKNKLADQIRNSKKFAEVFRTWVIQYPTFSTPLIEDTVFYFGPDPQLISLTHIPANGTTGIKEAFEETYDDYRIDLYRKEFLPHIPIPHRLSENRSRVPYSFFMTTREPPLPEDYETEPEPIDYPNTKFTDGSRLCAGGGWYEGRSWSVRTSVGRAETRNSETFVGPAVHLDVAGGQQHYLAKEEMESVEFVSPHNDPSTDKVAAIDWKDGFVTVAIETDLRYLAKYPETLDLTTDAPPRIKRVVLDQCRLDFALPGWVSHIGPTGLLNFTETGELLRDDRKLIEVACATIWQMAWIARRPFTVAFAEINPQSVNVGTFVETVRTSAGVDTTNTIITQIEYDFKTLKTKFTTQFEETDVVESLIGVSLQSEGGSRGRV